MTLPEYRLIRKRSFGWFCSVGLAAAGAFLIGTGIRQVQTNNLIRTEYEQSELVWKRKLAAGLDVDKAKDLQNQELLENKRYVSLEPEIYFESADSEGEIRLGNDKDSVLGCRLTLLEDTSGTVLYESGVIAPGYYIQWIRLNASLEAGYYSCTAVWSFYSQSGEYAGETAEKIVIIIKS